MFLRRDARLVDPTDERKPVEEKRHWKLHSGFAKLADSRPIDLNQIGHLGLYTEDIELVGGKPTLEAFLVKLGFRHCEAQPMVAAVCYPLSSMLLQELRQIPMKR
jgi:hypothetical protein